MPKDTPVNLTGKKKLDTTGMLASTARKAKRALAAAEEKEAQRLAQSAIARVNAIIAEKLTFQGKRVPLEDGELAQDPLRRIHIDYDDDKVLKLCASDIQVLLSCTPQLPISPPPRTVYVRQTALALLYQCPSDGFVQRMPAESNPSGNTKRMLAHLQPKEHPAMPLFPGMSGILLGSQHAGFTEDEGRWTLFRKLGTKGSSGRDSVYLGEYEVKVVGQMTEEQFSAQDKSAQVYHARKFLSKTRPSLMRARARIALRKAGVLPSVDKKTEEELVGKEVVEIRKKNGRPQIEVDILQALRNGDETLDIIRLQCVEYDHGFINHVEVALAAWKQVKKQANATGSPMHPTPPVPSDTSSTSSNSAIGLTNTQPIEVSTPHRDAQTDATPEPTPRQPSAHL